MKVRKSARIVVLNPAGAVLFLRYHDSTPVNPNKPELLTYWVPPGGGVEEGESFERAAIRELEEETELARRLKRFAGGHWTSCGCRRRPFCRKASSSSSPP